MLRRKKVDDIISIEVHRATSGMCEVRLKEVGGKLLTDAVTEVDSAVGAAKPWCKGGTENKSWKYGLSEMVYT